MSTRALLRYPTRNEKVGPIAALMLERATCPDICPLHAAGCYAENPPMAFTWDRLSDGRLGHEWPEIMRQIARLPRGVALRIGQAGDLPGANRVIDDGEFLSLVSAARHRGHRPILAYTHKPVLGVAVEAVHNRQLISRAVATGFILNLSANNGRHADFLSELALAPVAVVLPHDYGRRARHGDWSETVSEWRDRVERAERDQAVLSTPNGRRVIVCPAMYTDTTCAECMICSHPRNGAIIGFPTHGARRKLAERSCTAFVLEEV